MPEKQKVTNDASVHDRLKLTLYKNTVRCAVCPLLFWPCVKETDNIH